MRQFFKRRRHRIPYGVIMVIAVLALGAIVFMTFTFLMPTCRLY